jgi:hypothetical protein
VLTVIVLYQLHLGWVRLSLSGHISLLDLTLTGCALTRHHRHHALKLGTQLLLRGGGAGGGEGGTLSNKQWMQQVGCRKCSWDM